MPPASSTGFTATVGRIRTLPAERPHLRRCTKLLCSAVLVVLLLAAVLLFVAYLAVRPHRPRFHVVAFSASGIQQAAGGDGAGMVLLSGQFSVRNPNHDVGFFYDRLYLSVHYGNVDVVKDQDITGRPMYQPPKTTTPVTFEGVTVPASSATASMARDAGAERGSVAFTVKVRSRIRVRVAFWGSHWHPLHVGCDIAVGPDGQLLPESRQKRCAINFL
ncbi:hypothetical protein BRADI_5g22660v3 [Brachypodium distachyon]|uniref:Late embryogenesis abundant protein LEA-2 subgroup domain-containing protein n=2 Tax=Brachypodium distachyon TaxID=15368 RepID=I1J251_BRADI|nr:hypothetical protein BRADI_5g22660v3 [Brachypodium distachyon]